MSTSIEKEIATLREQNADLLTACKAWMRIESEMRENNPCPDLTLRAEYRRQAIILTKAVIIRLESIT